MFRRIPTQISQTEALAYAIRAQKNRRNLTSADIISAAQAYYKPMNKAEAGLEGGRGNTKLSSTDNSFTNGKGTRSVRTVDKVGKIIGVSGATVARALLVNSDAEVKAKVEDERMSIAAGADEVLRKRVRPAGSRNKPKEQEVKASPTTPSKWPTECTPGHDVHRLPCR